ncbi:MAG: DUF2231 domain-containing protein [Elusimicrobia bacterium]|nr:DUF2231 domain-containing protein [Elusimicrobiota bacterium]
MELFLLHPAFVHFPIALLSLGLAAELSSFLSRGSGNLARASSALLWLGTAAALAAAGLGLLAEKTVPHVPRAWETFAEHKSLGLWTAGVFSLLSAWRWLKPSAGPRLFLAAWLAATGLLFSAAYHGGELVFHYGVGVLTTR